MTPVKFCHECQAVRADNGLGTCIVCNGKLTEQQTQVFQFDTKAVMKDPGSLLHVDDDRKEQLTNDVVDYIEARFRQLNPGAPADALLCGGCVSTIAADIALVIAQRSMPSQADYRQLVDSVMKIEKSFKTMTREVAQVGLKRFANGLDGADPFEAAVARAFVEPTTH